MATGPSHGAVQQNHTSFAIKGESFGTSSMQFNEEGPSVDENTLSKANVPSLAIVTGERQESFGGPAGSNGASFKDNKRK
jgi:hypothetical protein